MPDLSAYINISAILDNSGASPVITIIDTSAYPVGVAQQIAGILSITEPDGIADSNTDFTHPNIYWQSGALVQAVRPLRLATNARFQNGGYSITYSVRCPGYSDTVLTKTFTLGYTAPVPVLSPAFDNFTPSLKVNDATNWQVAGLTLQTVNDAWSTVIRSVGGTNQTVTGAGTTADLVYQGSYYDAFYDVSLTAIVTWEIPGASPWVTVVDKFTPPTQTFQSEIPPTLAQLLTSLTVLKSQLDAAQSNPNYGLLQITYMYAVDIYTHLIDRGQSSALAGLSDYVWQLQKIFNNGQTPTYVNTNAVIPAYNWSSGGGSGSVAWNNVTSKPVTIQIAATPTPNQFRFTDARLANISANQLLINRNNIPEYGWTKNQADNFITFNNQFGSPETLNITILPL